MKCGCETPRRSVERTAEQGIQSIILRGTPTEAFITAVPIENETVAATFSRAADRLRGDGLQIVSIEVFGKISSVAGVFEDAFGAVTWPVTWIQEAPETQTPLAGIHVWAISGIEVEPVPVYLALGASALRCPFHPVFIPVDRMAPLGEYLGISLEVEGFGVDDHVVEIEYDRRRSVDHPAKDLGIAAQIVLLPGFRYQGLTFISSDINLSR